MTRVLIITLLVSLIGCTTYVTPSGQKIPERRLTDADKFGLLRAEAEKRGLRWRVFCTSYYTDEKENYLAVAEHKEAPEHAQYMEDGRLDTWMEEGATQADAAFALYNSIQGAPTHPKEYFKRPDYENNRTRRNCPREINSKYPESIPNTESHEMGAR